MQKYQLKLNRNALLLSLLVGLSSLNNLSSQKVNYSDYTKHYFFRTQERD